MKRILTYGTFDLLHWGHIRLLKRAKALGDYLIVGASTDEFVVEKAHRASYHPHEVRRSMLQAVRYVDLVIPEETWEQKLNDIRKYQVDTVVMGSDWEGSERFEFLRDYCELVYLPRTDGVSTSKIRRDLLTDAVTFPSDEDGDTSEADHEARRRQGPLALRFSA
ncbi:glycerol-3-phosphate cytidylyltransferase [Nesterenkonia flava]|uniref:glycerol-3-phosphate cytidylyltransferase n=1 Tax=Nesterenkonia flava TaxID=469799 RepID=UPI00286DF225|nr:glycerol-3-phosphate cytidylyltransferase [Nesterenkonia flava]